LHIRCRRSIASALPEGMILCMHKRTESLSDVEAELFRQGMRRLAGGVTIVTSSRENEPAGLTATAVCSLSAEPPRLLACINRQGRTYQTIAQSRTFCVNVLCDRQEDLALAFATASDAHAPGRFGKANWTKLDTGAPVLEGALVAFDCCVASIMDTGSHAVIIGDIRAIALGASGRSLIYVDGTFVHGGREIVPA